MMASYLRARLNEARFKDVTGLRRFARNLEEAIRSDIRHGADDEDGEAMLAFWANALHFVSSLGPQCAVGEAGDAR